MRASIRPVIAGSGSRRAAGGAVSCGDVVRQGGRRSLMVVDSLEAASGAEPGTMGGFLLSDVQTLVDRTINGQTVRVPTIFNDVGQATMRLIPKDAGNGSHQPGSDVRATP